MNFRCKSSERLKDVRGILTKRKEAPTPDPIFKSIDHLSIKLVYKIRTLSKQEEEQEHLLQKVPELFQFHWNLSTLLNQEEKLSKHQIGFLGCRPVELIM